MVEAQNALVQVTLAGTAPTTIAITGELTRDEREPAPTLAGWSVSVQTQPAFPSVAVMVDLGLDRYDRIVVVPDRDDDGPATIVATTSAGARLELFAVPSPDAR